MASVNLQRTAMAERMVSALEAQLVLMVEGLYPVLLATMHVLLVVMQSRISVVGEVPG